MVVQIAGLALVLVWILFAQRWVLVWLWVMPELVFELALVVQVLLTRGWAVV